MNAYQRAMYEGFFEELLDMQKVAMDHGRLPPTMILKLADFAPGVSGPALDYARGLGAKSVMDLDDKQLVEFSRRMGLNQEAIETAMPSAAKLPGGSQAPSLPKTVVTSGTMVGGAPGTAAKAGFFKRMGTRMRSMSPNLRRFGGAAALLGGGGLALGGAAALAKSRRQPPLPQAA